ncbi:MAG: beta-N-acetylglucosaminidase domain-containing protein [Clostridia bacterium]|nr:beta-N-acetylglucosaminidase domain-containing protein [Clostridia bacterium]
MPDIPAFHELFGDVLNDFDISISYLDSRRTLYCEKSHRVTDEKFILSICGRKIDIECSGEKSAFYALCDVAKRLSENRMCDGEYVCSPSFSVRGYIEGFYGTPWSHENRKSVMALMAKNRMNTVYYAPKDDLYHREKWREKYPEKELTKLKELVVTSKKYYMDFYWCIAPGLSMKYSDNDEFNALIEKTKQLYSIGITSFGLLLDDIDEELEFEEDKVCYGETVNAHIDLINRYYAALKEIDSSVKLTVCPTLYHGKGNEYYISKLGQNIPPRVSVFWTGRDICSRELTSFEALKFIGCTHHKPLYWDNYPVNDCSMYNEMHISPIINRDADLWKYSEGIISNCMEYAECSKIPLITFADFLWDSENYDSQFSWENAIKQVIGEKYADAFTVFADHLYTSCLKDANSRRMYEALDKIESAFKAEDMQKAISLSEEYLGKMSACKEFLMKDLPICRELSKWSEKFYVFCDLTEKIFEYIKSKDDSLKEKIFSLIDKYNTMPARLSNDTDIKSELKNLFAAVN